MRVPLLSAAALLICAPLSGQGAFGSAIAVRDSRVFVVQTGVGPGLPGLHVYRDSAGTIRSDGFFTPRDLGATGEGYSPSVAVTGRGAVVGSGDAAVASAAEAFGLGAGGWQRLGVLPLSERATPAAAPVDRAAVMRILVPPRRVVAVDGSTLVVGVNGGRISPHQSAMVFTAADDGTWARRLALDPGSDPAADGFGLSVAIRGDVIAVGAPPTGAVMVYRRRADGWPLDTVLTPADGAASSRFGAALAWDGPTLIVGAPGSGETPGAVIGISADAAGQWSTAWRLTDGPTPARFGAAVAVSADELWVGAPLAQNGRGRVARFVRSEADDTWEVGPSLVAPTLPSNGRFGSAIAMHDGLAAVGTPTADGGSGRVAIFRKTEEGWLGNWLPPSMRPEAVAGDEVPCREGQAVGFDCANVDLLAYVPLAQLGAAAHERVSDTWGWTDPQTQREYALVGRTAGATIVDITVPIDPVVVGTVPANPSGARDLKVYRDHLFFTGDGAGDHGLVVFDLTRVRAVSTPPTVFAPDTVYHGIASAHNLVINVDAGVAIPVGSSGGGETCGGGLHMIDIRNPTSPAFAGCYTDTEGLLYPGRTHDAQCIVYDGPDPDHRGREVCFASNETALRVVDVTDKTNPIPLAAVTFPGRAYIHQGWLSDDRRYFYLDDELDELVGSTDRTRTLVLDIVDLDDPVVVSEYFGPDRATDHNLYVRGNRMYQANYHAGLRVVDLTDPEQPREIGHFDTTPYGVNPPGFSGAWTAYPFFASGTVIVTSMSEGLFVLRPVEPRLIP